MLIVFPFSLVLSFTDDAALLRESMCVCVRLKGRGGKKGGGGQLIGAIFFSKGRVGVYLTQKENENYYFNPLPLGTQVICSSSFSGLDESSWAQGLNKKCQVITNKPSDESHQRRCPNC